MQVWIVLTESISTFLTSHMGTSLKLTILSPPPPSRWFLLPTFSTAILSHLKKAHFFPNTVLTLVDCSGYKNLKKHQTEELFEIGVQESSDQGTAVGLPLSTLSFPCLNLVSGTGQLGPFIILSNGRKFSGLKKITCSWIFKMNDGYQTGRSHLKMWREVLF